MTLVPLRPTTLGLIALAIVSGACATTPGATPRPFPMPGRPPAVAARPAPPEPAPQTDPAVEGLTDTVPAAPPLSLAESALISTALELRGVPYRYGGSDLSGFDCSGFTQYVFAKHGVRLPREVQDQFRTGFEVDARELEAGDLLFFATTSPSASHVGIAIGSDTFIHAPSSKGVVRIEHLGLDYWTKRFVGVRRVLGN